MSEKMTSQNELTEIKSVPYNKPLKQYSGPQPKHTCRRKMQNDRRLGIVGIFTYYKNNMGRILNNIIFHGQIKQN
jgi:hypothetical protein